MLNDACNAAFRNMAKYNDDVIKWKPFPRYWPFVRGIHQSPVNSPHNGQWRGAMIFSLICAWIDGWVNYREAGDFGRNRAHYNFILMYIRICWYRHNKTRHAKTIYIYVVGHSARDRRDRFLSSPGKSVFVTSDQYIFTPAALLPTAQWRNFQCAFRLNLWEACVKDLLRGNRLVSQYVIEPFCLTLQVLILAIIAHY